MRFGLLAMLLAAAACPVRGQVQISAQNHAVAQKKLGDHYLMLVNTAISFLVKPGQLAQFDKSPYDGIAVTFSYNYDTEKPASPEKIESQVAEFKKATGKDVWPWVFMNRMIGLEETDKNPHNEVEYFHKLKGADLDDATGARSDFLANFTGALQAARDTGNPGIMVDLEFYNFHKGYDIGLLASQSGKTPDAVASLLKQLGADMADIAAQKYPDASLWFMFTGLGFPEHFIAGGQKYYPSPTYVVLGLLDEIQKKHYGLKVISGGEGSLAYCHESLEQFRAAIQKRSATFAPMVQKYGGILELGGTMTLYADRTSMTGWVKDDCSNSSASTVEDLQPFLELLLKSFRYNWIYGSADGKYAAFDAQSAPRFDAVIRKAQSHVVSGGLN